jgi:hypothetical protein
MIGSAKHVDYNVIHHLAHWQLRLCSDCRTIARQAYRFSVYFCIGHYRICRQQQHLAKHGPCLFDYRHSCVCGFVDIGDVIQPLVAYLVYGASPCYGRNTYCHYNITRIHTFGLPIGRTVLERTRFINNGRWHRKRQSRPSYTIINALIDWICP